MDSAATTRNDKLLQLTRLVDEHEGDLKSHMKVVRDFRTHLSLGEDSESLGEEQLQILENLTHEFKETVTELCDCLSGLQTTKNTIPTGAPEHGRRPPKEDKDRRGGYEESLSKAVERWKSNAKKRREKGCRSLVEWRSELGPDEGKEEERQEREAFSFIKNMASKSGSEISDLLAEYLTLLAWSTENQEELLGKLQHVQTTFQSLSFAGDGPDSIIVETFVDLAVAMRMEIMQRRATGNPNGSNNNGGATASFEFPWRIEHRVLEVIFGSALRLEVEFSFPYFKNRRDKEYVLGTLNKIKDSLSMRVTESSSTISGLQSPLWNAAESPEVRNLNRTLHSLSSVHWKGLDFI